MITAEDLIRELGLEPLPVEGGMFRETYRTRERCAPRAGAKRAVSTAIYFLLTAETCSRLHRLKGDEVYHFYLGDPVELLVLEETGGGITRLGTDILAGERPQKVVPGGVWQGSRVVAGGRFALMGTTMAPGFDIADFELGERAELTAAHPEHAELIRALT